MNRELEALENLGRRAYLKESEHRMFSNRCINTWECLPEYQIIKQALTPPTADEVCKALSEYYGKKVIFKENVFWYKTIIYDNEQWVREVSLKDLSKDNRGDLITMIGRFYEELER